MKKVLIGLVSLIALGCTISTIVLAIKYNSIKGEKEILVSQNASLQATVDSIGPIATAWTIIDGLDVEAGDEVLEEHLIQITVPANSVNENWVLNKGELVGKYYKVHIDAGTSFTKDLLMETESVDDFAYERDISLPVLPVGLEVGDYVSIRFNLPYGEEFIVYEKKRVKAIHENTVKLDMSETDLNIWSSVIRDMGIYGTTGAALYCVKYNEPGVASETVPFYCIRQEMYPIVTLNPNIADKTRLINEELRKYIDYQLERARTEELMQDSTKVSGEISREQSAIMGDYKIVVEEQSSAGTVVSDSVKEEQSGQNFDAAVNDAKESIDANIGQMMYEDEETID